MHSVISGFSRSFNALVCLAALRATAVLGQGEALSLSLGVNMRSNTICSGFLACTCHNSTTPTDYRLTLQVDVPAAPPGGRLEPVTPIFFFHGFGGRLLLSTSNYLRYAEGLQDAGFAFIQYDVVAGGSWPLEVVQDTIEVTFLPQLLAQLRGMVQNPASPLWGRLDLDRVLLAGHSRGGKLAVLHYSSGLVPEAAGAFLLDPIDCPCNAPQGPCYPSAYEAFKDTGKDLGLVGATIKGCCNPNDTSSGGDAACSIAGEPCSGFDYKDFKAVAGPGSSLTELPIGHLQLAEFNAAECTAANLLCGANPAISQDQAQDAAIRAMAAYFTRLQERHRAASQGISSQK